MSKKEEKNNPEDDIQIEMEEEIVEEGSLQDKLKKLREELKVCKEESKTNLDGWQRARADYSNLQRSLEDERGQIRKRAVEGLVLDLLPTLDTFDMAMKDKNVWESVDEKWRIGIEHIYNQFKKTLEEHGVTEISESEDFNPEHHEPLETIDTENEDEADKIINVLQKGYMMNGNVIRPAKVKIYTLVQKEKE
jgi:molecular chaperone GrpE